MVVLLSLALLATSPDAGEAPVAPLAAAAIPLEACDGLTVSGIDVEVDGWASELRGAAPAAAAGRRRRATRRRCAVTSRRCSTSATSRASRREIVAIDGRSVRLKLRVDEAWSIMPIFGYTGGSVLVIIAGAYSADVFGEMVEVGGYYMRRDAYNLVRAWVVMPNVITYGSQLELQFVNTARTLLLYPSDPAAAPPELRDVYGEELRWRIPARGYEVVRRGGYVDYGLELSPDFFTASLRYLYMRETTVSLPNVVEVVDHENRDLDPVPLERADSREANLSLININTVFGQIDLIDNYRFTGQELRAIMVASSTYLGSARDFLWLYLTYRGFFHPVGELELAVRATAAGSTSRDPRDQFILGSDNLDPFVYNQKFPGLLTLRGFKATQFHGQDIYFLNLEARHRIAPRIPLWILGEAVVQAAVFATRVRLGWCLLLAPRRRGRARLGRRRVARHPAGSALHLSQLVRRLFVAPGA